MALKESLVTILDERDADRLKSVDSSVFEHAVTALVLNDGGAEVALDEKLQPTILFTEFVEGNKLITLEIPKPDKPQDVTSLSDTFKKRRRDKPLLHAVVVDLDAGKIAYDGTTTYRQYEFVLSPKGTIIYREDYMQEQLPSAPSNTTNVVRLPLQPDTYDNLPYHERALQRYTDLMGILTSRLEPFAKPPATVLPFVRKKQRK